MTELLKKDYFQFHNENIQLLKVGYEDIRTIIKDYYKRESKSGDLLFSLPHSNVEREEINAKVEALSRVLSGIQVSWAEECIKRLLYENKLFSLNQINHLITLPALDQKWYKTLHITFCKAYDLVPTGDEKCETVNINHQRGDI